MIFLGIAFWLLIGAGLRGAYEHARDDYRRTRDARIKAATKAAGGKLPKAQKQKALRRHAWGYWAGEVSHGFPVTRTGYHAGWLAHKTAAEHQRAVRDAAQTTHLETVASFAPGRAEHRRRHEALRKEISDTLGDAPEGQRTGRKAARKAADEVAAKRAERESRTDAPVTGTPAPPGELSHWLDPAAGSPCGGCGGSGRNRDRTDACPACRGWGAAPPDPDGPIGPPGTVCAACGRHATGEDPVLADAKVHRSHAVEQTRAYQDALGRMRQPTPGTSDAERAAAWANECAAREPGPDAARNPEPLNEADIREEDPPSREPEPVCTSPFCAGYGKPWSEHPLHDDPDSPGQTTTASPTTTEGAPPVSDITYDNVIATAKSQVAHADAAGSDLRAQLTAAEQAAEGMQAANVDSGTLSAQLDHVDALRAAVRAVDAVGESAGSVESTTARNHGGINEAHQSAPVKAAESGFYEG